MSQERHRRPLPIRTGPIRGATESFRSPFTAASVAGESPFSGAIDEAVRTAYRVVDEYIELGWQSAARHRPTGERPMNPLTSNVQEITTLAMRFWLEMAETWMMPLSQAAPWRAWAGGNPDAAWDRGADASPCSTTTNTNERSVAGERLAVTLSVASQQPSQVTVDLQPGSAVTDLAVQDLRAVDDAEKPPLVAVRCDAIDGRLRVEMSVPRDQPSGVYVGAIVDRVRHEARGTVTVVVRDPEALGSDG